ncbi:MAG TPA: TetR/AcrR family transcriptional regulator C-terminal domain-containing protein [Streptosporangiaceae bacterium]|nr:TetR/AcrR family transcriptional regulator C-terminal domain-containing protein [Streptosporangiaceae bacterium]
MSANREETAGMLPGPGMPPGAGADPGPGAVPGPGVAQGGSGMAGAGAGRRRGPQPRHTRQEVARAAVAIADAEGLAAVTIRAVAARLGTGVMSLYSYVPDKQTLVYDMVEEVSGELDLPEPSGDWRADMHLLARLQRAVLHRHPWMIEATTHLQPLGPAILATLEFALGALEPTGLTAGARLETFALVNGFAAGLVRAELATQAAAVSEPDRAADQAARLQELLATGRYPRFAAAVVQSGPPAVELGAQFERLLDRILDGLVAGNGA